jgi:FKBP-type peptidyl-prolyl cis-trans isomerase FkpA
MVGLALVALVVLAACSNAPKEAAPTAAQPEQSSVQEATPAATPAEDTQAAPAPAPAKTKDVTKLEIKDLVVGKGAVAKAGMSVTVNYTGWLTDGTKFDSSLDRNEPFTFALGQGQVIRGWDDGVAGMKVGGKRKLTIPPDMGYGAQGAGGSIPPNATLVFEVELLGVK